jgi:uncharacterized repeat protein (TIGR02543 family)
MKRIFSILILVLSTAVVLTACGGGGGGGTNPNPTYTVTYNGNGNTGGNVPIDTTNYEQGQTVTVLANTGNLVNTNFTFAGWNTQADGSGTTYAQGQTFAMGTVNVTLYAKWTANPTYTVTYNGNSNTGGSVPVDSTNYQPGQTVTVLGNTGNLVNTGYSFAGWNTLADGSGTTYTQAQTFTMGAANVTLYAMWTASPIYTVCIPSGDQQDINAKLSQTGDVAVLCSGAVFELTAPVVFSADGQQVYTEGCPTVDRRAVLRVASALEPSAVLMRDRSDAVLSNVIVDGNRPNLGPRSGQALIYAGGWASGQVIREVKAFDTRSWSTIQIIQGGSIPCTGALIENNEIGPAGQPDGSWADGISFGCTNSVVRNNTITDATDGGKAMSSARKAGRFWAASTWWISIPMRATTPAPWCLAT